mgnify:CR=1 FL=1
MWCDPADNQNGAIHFERFHDCSERISIDDIETGNGGNDGGGQGGHDGSGNGGNGNGGNGNGGNGVVVTGPSSDRRATGISASGNALFGLAVVGQAGTRLADIATGTLLPMTVEPGDLGLTAHRQSMHTYLPAEL